MKRIFTYDAIVAISLLSLSLFMFYYLVHSLGGLFFQHDAYYYLAIAESLLNSGEMLDASSIPAKPVISPQNGIVFVMVLFKFLGIQSNVDILLAVGVVNYICFACFAFLIYKIYQIFGMDRHTSFIFAASIVLSLYYARIYIQSINDPIFITLSTFVVYLILLKKEDYKTLMLLGLCALVLSSFRLSGVFVFFSAAIAYLYLKNTRMAVFFTVLTIVTYLSQAFIVDYFVLNQDGIQAMKQKTFDSYSIEFFIKNILHTVTVNIPEALFAYEKMYTDLEIKSKFITFLISASVILSLLFFVKRAVAAKDFKYIFIAVYIIAYLCFLQLFFVLVTRYILVIAPFFALLLLMLVKKNRVYVSLGFLIISLSITLIVPPDDARTKEGVSKRAFYEKMHVALNGEDYDSIVSGSRVAFLLLGQPSLSKLSDMEKKVLVVGPQRWSMVVIQQLAHIKRSSVDMRQLESYIMHDGTTVESYLIEFK